MRGAASCGAAAHARSSSSSLRWPAHQDGRQQDAGVQRGHQVHPGDDEAGAHEVRARPGDHLGGRRGERGGEGAGSQVARQGPQQVLLLSAAARSMHMWRGAAPVAGAALACCACRRRPPGSRQAAMRRLVGLRASGQAARAAHHDRPGPLDGAEDADGRIVDQPPAGGRQAGQTADEGQPTCNCPSRHGASAQAGLQLEVVAVPLVGRQHCRFTVRQQSSSLARTSTASRRCPRSCWKTG
jgi:hypothetical protein